MNAMGVLQKKAWVELVVMLVCAVVAAGALALMVRLDTQGVGYVVGSAAAAALLGLMVYLHNLKAESGLDEREKDILRKACMLAASAFVVFIGIVSFISFFLAGGGGDVPVYVLPATFFGALFVAQFVQSAAILIKLTREQVDG